ncbi:hypothetical protein GCM10011385_26440 [Nitratireductor aestuarii]|uniref:Transporter n=1 Tax=Nitratireductor aestuarii TaxID=1735103 RepID=A0A916W6V9_9HYPH|nr:transporter [Nitratireductor aestuarii]GGA71314.1 hypothetical protein GCM10011385_26440 [Nitratireductor aestuarii]
MTAWGADIQLYFYGVWRLMTGRQDGLRLLDISVDGFWNSFFAILVALPALLISWLTVANEAEALMLLPGSRFDFLARLVVSNVGAWVLPLVALGVVAPYVRIADRYVHYVVATNWATALVAWMMLPPTLLQIFFPHLEEISVLLSLILFFVTLFLSWRVTVAAIGRGPAVGTGVFFAMVVASVTVLLFLQSLLGVQIEGL